MSKGNSKKRRSPVGVYNRILFNLIEDRVDPHYHEVVGDVARAFGVYVFE
ncbi:MAG: hypothetical protein R3336_02815 [Phycisphaeraceae bacterium]|nr:hypothetical protein [Phycisphaeraceae bacterium]